MSEDDPALGGRVEILALGRLDEEAVLEGLGDARLHVHIEAFSLARSACGAWGSCRRTALELGSHRQQHRHGYRRPDHGEEPQHAAAFRGSQVRAGRHEAFERACERDARQFAPRREQLFGDERVSSGAFGDQEKSRRRGAAALDDLDQLAQFGPVERRKL